MMKTRTGYTLKNIHGGELIYDFFPFRKQAVSHAKYLLSNQTMYDWKEIYEVVKVTMSEVEKEIIICAAIKTRDGLIIRGHRHADCIRTMETMKLPKAQYDLDIQGFVTSTNRFVDRKEGFILQRSAKVKSLAVGGYDPSGELFSEDLY